jgi:AraC-like DNA-binding protein
MSLADTAAECLFFDQSHFTRTFRLYTGLNPSDFSAP